MFVLSLSIQISLLIFHLPGQSLTEKRIQEHLSIAVVFFISFGYMYIELLCAKTFGVCQVYQFFRAAVIICKLSQILWVKATPIYYNSEEAENECYETKSFICQFFLHAKGETPFSCLFKFLEALFIPQLIKVLPITFASPCFRSHITFFHSQISLCLPLIRTLVFTMGSPR